MKILISQEQLTATDINNNQDIFAPSLPYIIPDNIFMLLYNSVYRDKIITYDFFDKYKDKKYNGQDLTGKSIIAFRNGGIGDLFFMLPSLKEYKKVYKDCNITLCCGKQYATLFSGIDYIDKVIHLPLLEKEIIERDYFVDFEGLMEGNPEAEILNAYDLTAKHFHIKPESNIPDIVIDEDINNLVIKELNNYKGDKRIVLSWMASVPIRSQPIELYNRLIEQLPESFKYYIVGSRRQIEGIDKFINQSKYKNRLVNWTKKNIGDIRFVDDLRFTVSLIKNSDIVISSDSGLLHIAGAVGTKMIGLYGPFPSQLRLKYYKNAVGLDGKIGCYFGRGEYNSCFQHGNGNCKLANKHMQYFSPCLTLMEFEKMIVFYLKKFKILQDGN